jgi:predicted AAA+ superfamily ATPase
MAYLHRVVDGLFDDLFGQVAAIMITGPRGCGKTTTAMRRAASLVRLDDPLQALAFRAAPDLVLAENQEPVLIDEWQEVPEVLGAVKRAVDTGQGKGRFLITGSIRSRRSGQSWPATGRVVPVGMFGLTAGEIEQSDNAANGISQLFGSTDPVPGVLPLAPDLIAYVRMAVQGGFPDVLETSGLAHNKWYEGYVEQLIHRDVAQLEDIRNPTGLRQLVHAVALNTAGLISITKLAESAGLNQRTASVYLDLLEDMRIIERLPGWGSNRFNRMSKAVRYLILDPGMAAFISGDDEQRLMRDGVRLGRIIETFVAAQLRPLLSLQSPSVAMLHMSTQDKKHSGDDPDNRRREVDFILESAAGQVVGIEVKSAAAVSAGDARHLAWLRDQLGDQFVRGFVLHTGNMTYPLGDRLWAMPIAALWR